MNFPKLRFKEFNDEWRKYKVEEILKISNGINKGKEFFGSGTPIINYMDVNKNELISHNIVKGLVIANSKELETFNVKKGDILFTRTSETSDEIGLSSSVIENIDKCIFSGFILKGTQTKNFIHHYFGGYYFRNPKMRKEIIKHSSITTRALTSGSLLAQMSISIPTIIEQEKIGKTLSLLDKKIELQNKKIEDLKLFKKGLINVLNKKSYQETTLGKIGKFQTSSIDKLVKENEKIVSLYNYMDVYKHKIIMTQDLSKLSKTSAKDNQIITNNLKRGDILFTPSSETPDDIGHSICIQENLPNTVYSYHLLRYRPNIIIDPLFSNYYFNNSKIRKQIIRYATGATRYTVSLDSFLKIKVDIPDLITQKKYGLLLYSTDKKVNKEMFKLNKLRELKKGLMQDMFV